MLLDDDYDRAHNTMLIPTNLQHGSPWFCNQSSPTPKLINTIVLPINPSLQPLLSDSYFPVVTVCSHQHPQCRHLFFQFHPVIVTSSVSRNEPSSDIRGDFKIGLILLSPHFHSNYSESSVEMLKKIVLKKNYFGKQFGELLRLKGGGCWNMGANHLNWIDRWTIMFDPLSPSPGMNPEKVMKVKTGGRRNVSINRRKGAVFFCKDEGNLVWFCVYYFYFFI